MPSEIRSGTGYETPDSAGKASVPKNVVFRKFSRLIPGWGDPPVPEKGIGQKPRVPACGAEEVFVSLSCYRSALRSAQKLCLVLAGFAAAGLAAGLCAILTRPEPVYFGMSQDMKLLPMTPLDKPVMNEAALKNWVAGAISASFNFDYLNWRSQLTNLRTYFTGEAFTRFAVSLDKEGHLPLLRQRRALMHSVVQGTPVLTRSGVVRGTLVWEFEVPLLVTYETSRGRVANNAVTVVCQVRRMPAADCPAGVALSSVVTVKRENAGGTP